MFHSISIRRQAVLAALLSCLLASCGGGGGGGSPTPDSQNGTSSSSTVPTPTGSTAVVPVPIPTGGRSVAVANSAQLQAAIAGAQPGDVITLADGSYTGAVRVGNYTGSFTATIPGTADQPILLTGGRGAVIDGHGTGGHYGLYLVGAHHWSLQGITVSGASKGIVLDGSNHVIIDHVKVSEVGQEAIHLRAFSSDNVVQNCEVSGTGRTSPQYGEGVYIGSANSNWATYTNGQPDKSDRNKVIANRFSDFSAEAIDIKEGSSNGVIADNWFDGSSISGKNSADSWVDVKGNSYLLSGNTGVNTLLDGFQVHRVYAGWGYSNVFRNNVADVRASGYGFNVVSDARGYGNVIACSNTVTNAGAGLSNIACVTE